MHCLSRYYGIKIPEYIIKLEYMLSQRILQDLQDEFEEIYKIKRKEYKTEALKFLILSISFLILYILSNFVLRPRILQDVQDEIQEMYKIRRRKDKSFWILLSCSSPFLSCTSCQIFKILDLTSPASAFGLQARVCRWRPSSSPGCRGRFPHHRRWACRR